MLFTPKSILYYPEYYTEKYDEKIELSDHIILPAFYIHTLLTRYNEPPYLVKITNTSNDMSYIVSIGTPHMYDKTIAFVPQWILHIIGISDIDDSIIRIEKYDEELPVATSITIRPLDRILFDTNIIECCQQAMLILHTIKKGTLIPIKIPGQNDNCTVVIHDLEPDNICRIQEGELPVHFINDFVSIPNPIESIITTEEKLGELSLEEKRHIAREARLKRFC
jgi:hypothetical protein